MTLTTAAPPETLDATHVASSAHSTNAVTAVPAADSEEALAHFESAFRFETDCWDVHDALSSGAPGFVLMDARSHALYDAGHIPGAISMPHGKITEGRMSVYPRATMFVVYCAGPHCNGGHRAAVRLARLGRPVKLMTGGITGWQDEGFALVR
ncbi:rhodanese-like domain-containing protein [Roseateles terrae]|uniref:Rhodanese-related sulfurtransferase n=1 Tax=Roseateles terrae TaxID=431060 RepID=A0ABR6GZM0_9BURK|nr:rhodanese-like domain-containing protein [Roseateles terrae]MBB3197206.1 rhodanese-related sulfurtransferase [Roseateles terrae]OWQ83725.1 rhodanese [Roseateles terrae]